MSADRTNGADDLAEMRQDIVELQTLVASLGMIAMLGDKTPPIPAEALKAGFVSLVAKLNATDAGAPGTESNTTPTCGSGGSGSPSPIDPLGDGSFRGPDDAADPERIVADVLYRCNLYSSREYAEKVGNRVVTALREAGMLR